MDKLKINNQTYKLSTDNYCKTYHSKEQIVLTNTFSENMNHITGWKRRLGGKYKRTTNYTIDIYGNIYQHFPPQFHSKFFNISGLDEHIITISIENEGWLVKDVINNSYINYVGNIYNRSDGVIEKNWRNHKYWAPYTKEQINSSINLCKHLCSMFGIPRQAMSHNTKFEDIYNFRGITYKSNYNKYYSDLSPAWNYTEFKNKIEEN